MPVALRALRALPAFLRQESRRMEPQEHPPLAESPPEPQAVALLAEPQEAQRAVY